jgi:hypothetical protein
MRPKERLGWLVRRASVMSGREVAYRARKAAAKGLRRIGLAVGVGALPSRPRVDPARYAFLSGPDSLIPSLPWERTPDEPLGILDGQVPVFDGWIPWRDVPEFWHTDPLVGVTWPMRPTDLIEYRPGNPIGDARLVWELNRLQHLLPLARIAAEDPPDRPRAVEILDTQIRSWVDANPPGMGVNHASAMEAALRILSVTHAFDLARRHLSETTRRLVGEMVLSHAMDVERGLSLHSSAGNHTIAEAAGLLYAGLLFGEHPRAPTWERIARALLATEGARQVNGDGGGLEQAPWYLLFVADLLGLAQALLRDRGASPIPEIDLPLERARGFLQAFGTSPRALPPLGDGDSGYALSPRLRVSWRPARPQATFQEFPDSGLTLVRPGEGERLIFLHGPLGMPPAFGHGHAHALSVLLQHRGRDLLIDPGTYLYGGPRELRRYFRSTAAHNTLVVDGRDQAEQVAPFMWRGAYRCEVVVRRVQGSGYLILARHDGYRRLGIIHWRGLVYQPGGYLLIWDRVAGRGDRDANFHWHFGCPARLEGGEVVLEPAGLPAVRMSLPEGNAEMFEGSEEPLLGWRSTSYGSRVRCPTLRIQPSAGTRPEALTTLWLDGGTRPRLDLDRLLEPFRSSADASR